MKSFRRFAFFTTIATYILIFTGGLVRVSGAGLGCPDWPKCFGRWIPPTSLDQLPPDMDPAQFNIVLAWIEYSNRLLAMIVGLLIVVTAVWAMKSFRGNGRILWSTTLAAVLTAVQGWQGSVVVASHLQPLIVSVHTVLALIIVSLLIYATQEAYCQENRGGAAGFAFPIGVNKWLGLLWLAAMVQIALGTQMRAALEVLREQFPLLTSAEWISRVGLLNHVHMTLGVLLAALSWAVGFALWKYRDRFLPPARQSLVALVILATAQLLSGLLFIFMKLTPMLQVFHLWLASLYVGTALTLYAMTKRREVPS